MDFRGRIYLKRYVIARLSLRALAGLLLWKEVKDDLISTCHKSDGALKD